MKLIVGYIGKGNLGDEIILKEYLSQNKNEKYIICSYGLDYKGENIDSVFIWEKSKFQNIYFYIKNILKCKEVEWIGGTCFSDEDGIGGFNYMIIASLFLKKINYLYIGINKLKKRKSIIKSKILLMLSSKILLRDLDSLSNIKNLITKDKYTIVKDNIVNDLGDEYLQKFHLINKDKIKNKDYILISWRDLSRYIDNEEKVLNNLSNLIQKYCKNNKVVILIDADDSLDYKVNSKLIVNVNSSNLIYKKNISIDEKLSLIANASLVITARLHIAIAGSIFGKKTYALNYSNKMTYQQNEHNYFLFDYNDLSSKGFTN
jgi:polysaccharide pyruvyl transferase WcaK-like protein